MTRRAFTSAHGAAIGPYSHAIETGGLLFLSGQTPVDPATGQLVPGGIEEQTHQCLRNLLAVLTAAGLSSDDVVKCTVYLTNMDDFAAMNEVYREYFTEPRPARTTVEVARLPRDAMIEIEMIAQR